MNRISIEERQRLIEDILQRNLAGQETLGTAIRRLRIEVTGLDQQTFARMCKISTKALYQLESDKGNPTLNTLNGILRMFGMQMVLGSVRASVELPKQDRTEVKKRGHRPPSRSKSMA